jgi:choline dehydrogenase
MMIFCLPCDFRGYRRNYFRPTVNKKNMCTWLVLHENKGDSNGVVKLNRHDITGQPKINFHYHTEDPENPNDSQPLIEGVKAVRKLIASYGSLIANEAWPGADVQDEDALRAKIESHTWGHHANGSARMGKPDDAGAVVDGDLKVIGVQRFASAMPRSSRVPRQLHRQRRGPDRRGCGH